MAEKTAITADADIVSAANSNLELDETKSLAISESHNYDGAPTEEEKYTLRRIAGKLPMVAYFICAVEFAERASYYGVQPLIGNYVNRPMPTGGNGYGAPPRGTQETAGALGMGTVKASAVSQSFSMLAYSLVIFTGWYADTKSGRFQMVCWGVGVFGIAHILMVVSGAPSLLANGNAKIPYFISLYILSVGAAMFKPCISPILLDQMQQTKPVVKSLPSGERVIIDPEATTERVMLWFYLLINIGGFMNVPTAYTEKYVGWWLSFLLPLILYLPLPLLLWYLKKRMILHPPGGSDLGNVMRILSICFKRGGAMSMFKGGFFEHAKPSVIARSSHPIEVNWNDEFVHDVKRAFQASGMFCFFPLQSINDNGLGGATSALSTMLTTNGVPNDVISNFNSLSIILMAPVLNYGLYPFLRKYKIHFGSIARITFGLGLATTAGVGYTVLNYYAYKVGPCGKYGSSATCVDSNDISLVSSISIWYMAIPYAIGGISELFVNVPAYGLAYSMAPKNMRGTVSAINLFMSAISYALGLAFSGLIVDPYLTWDFGGPAIAGGIGTIAFWWIYKDLDKEEYTLTENGDYHLKFEQHDGQEITAGEGSETEASKVDEKHALKEQDLHV